MRAIVLSLGLALLCLLHVEAEDQGAAEINKNKIAGKWHIVALASDSEGYLRKKDELKMSMANILLLENGTLKVSLAIPTSEGCKKSEFIFKKIGIPGEFYYSERGNKTVQVMETDYKSYAIIFASRVKDGKTLHMLRLYSRTREVSPKITELFRKLAKEQSYTDEMIKMLPSQEECGTEEP
ncbi:extracellular fatty acid-binding protein [Struthio camelus]|uniref:extracellular fatty acid-binding protein n=1 Tax=Struthio camelus TaxID=8801 RepID=UPI00051E3D7B|nr:PREDICTED: lipocalin-like 1 protein [Struthio camelus australis]